MFLLFNNFVKDKMVIDFMKINTLANNQNNITFNGLRPRNITCNMYDVPERLKLIPTVNHKNFFDLAANARINATTGNGKPQMLVEMMVRFVSGVEELMRNGISFPTACVKLKRELCSDFAGNQHLKDTFSERWEYLAKNGSNRQDSYTNNIKPKIRPTDKKISFTYTDVRDMLEFLRKNWRHGNAAYRQIMLGKGPKGWIKYLREEIFPNHYDEFYRKY